MVDEGDYTVSYAYRVDKVSRLLECAESDIENALSAACTDMLIAEGAILDGFSQSDLVVAGGVLCQYILENPSGHHSTYIELESSVTPWGKKIPLEMWVKSMVRDIGTLSMGTDWAKNPTKAWRCVVASLLLHYRYCEDGGEYFPVSRIIGVCRERASRESDTTTQSSDLQKELIFRAVEATGALDNPPFAAT